MGTSTAQVRKSRAIDICRQAGRWAGGQAGLQEAGMLLGHVDAPELVGEWGGVQAELSSLVAQLAGHVCGIRGGQKQGGMPVCWKAGRQPQCTLPAKCMGSPCKLQALAPGALPPPA